MAEPLRDNTFRLTHPLLLAFQPWHPERGRGRGQDASSRLPDNVLRLDVGET